MQNLCGCEGQSRSTSENLNRCVQPKNESLLDPLRGSKARFMEDARSACCKNPLTSTRVILFVVRMWLKHPSSEPTDSVSRSARPRSSDVLCQIKSHNVSKMQTLKRLIRNRVKNVITIEASNKSKALQFVQK